MTASATPARPSEGEREKELKHTTERVAALLAGFDAIATPRQAREQADELARTLVRLYGTGLERVLSIVYEHAGDRAGEIFERLCDDKFVESLLCLHNLHPVPIEERIEAALDSVRPYLRSHAGGVELIAHEDGIATLRFEGTCDGCPSSAVTMKNAVERAIFERVPEIVEVRALASEPELPPSFRILSAPAAATA